jgi:ketosteroid isomerase-like protein
MDHDEMRVIIETYITAYNTFDLDKMYTLLHQDIVFQDHSNGKMNLATQGIEEFRYVAEQAQKLFSRRSQRVTTCKFEGDRAEVDIDFEGVFALEIPGWPKAGETIKLKGKSIFTFKDGLIASLYDYC